MVASNQTVHLEGIWEEIVLRGDLLAGRRVRVTVLPQAPPAKSLAEALAPLIEQAAQIPLVGEPIDLNNVSSAFADGVADQLREQGLKT